MIGFASCAEREKSVFAQRTVDLRRKLSPSNALRNDARQSHLCCWLMHHDARQQKGGEARTSTRPRRRRSPRWSPRARRRRALLRSPRHDPTRTRASFRPRAGLASRARVPERREQARRRPPKRRQGRRRRRRRPSGTSSASSSGIAAISEHAHDVAPEHRAPRAERVGDRATEEAEERIGQRRDGDRDGRQQRRLGRAVSHERERDEGDRIAESADDLRQPEEREVGRPDLAPRCVDRLATLAAT